MQQFKISEAGFSKFRKKWFTIMIPLMVILAVIIILTNVFSGKPGEVNTLPFVIPILAVFFGFNFYRSLRKQKKFLLSYSVTISDEGITREQLNTPPLSISFMEIKEITKTEKGGYSVKGVDRTDVIYIPHWVENPAALETCLQRLAPIKLNTKAPLYMKYKSVLFILAIAMMISVYVVTNKIIVGICGPLLTGLFVWAFYEVRTSKNIPKNAKRSSWFFLLVIISIIYVTYAKLTGTWDMH